MDMGSEYMGYLFILLYFLLFNATSVFYFKKSFGKCLPLTLMIGPIIMLIIYTLFGSLNAGFIVCLLPAIAIIPTLLFNIRNKKRLNEFAKNYFSTGFYAFLVLFLIIVAHDFGRRFSAWDEFSHWGKMLKEMLRLDKLYSIPASTLGVHKDYPPIMQLFELICVKLKGGYSESVIISSVHLLEFSLFIPAISEMKKFKNNIFKIISIFIIVFLMLLFFDGHEIINTIYNDYPLALISAYGLYLVFETRKEYNIFNILLISVTSVFLLLTKQICISFYAMMLFLFTMLLLFNKEYKKFNWKKWITLIILLIVFPLGSLTSWNNYKNNLGLKGQFNISDIKLTEMIGIVAGKSGESYQIETSRNYVKALQETTITTSYINLSYIQLGIIVILLLYFMCNYKKDIDEKEKKSILLTFVLGTIGYAFIMHATYIFCFNSYEGPKLASYNRYMPTYIIIVLTFMIMLLINIWNKNKKLNYIYVLLIIMVAIQSSNVFSKTMPSLSSQINPVFEEDAKIINNVVKEGDKVYIIAQETDGMYQQYIQYYLNDGIKNNFYDYSFNTEIDNVEGYFYNNYYDLVKEYDYVFLAVINDEFKAKYNFLFDDEIVTNGIYKIKKKNNKIILKAIKK